MTAYRPARCNKNSIASEAGPVTGMSPASHRRIVRSPLGPSRSASANPIWDRPRRCRADLIASGVINPTSVPACESGNCCNSSALQLRPIRAQAPSVRRPILATLLRKHWRRHGARPLCCSSQCAGCRSDQFSLWSLSAFHSPLSGGPRARDKEGNKDILSGCQHLI